jgi:hypothetical protein
MTTQVIISWIKEKYAAGWYASQLIGLQMELRELLVINMFWLIFVFFFVSLIVKISDQDW